MKWQGCTWFFRQEPEEIKVVRLYTYISLNAKRWTVQQLCGFEGERIRLLPNLKPAPRKVRQHALLVKIKKSSVDSENESAGSTDSPWLCASKERYRLFHSVSDDEGAWLATQGKAVSQRHH